MSELHINEDIEVKVEGFTGQGAGVARYEGMAIFIPGALPGEKVAARIVDIRKNYAVARMTALLEPFPSRVKPLCPIFSHCGGCALQHTVYQNQLGLKTVIVKGAMQRIGKIDTEVKPIIGAVLPYHYRNRMRYHVANEQGKISLGFYAPKSKRFVAAPHCDLAAPPIAELAMLLPEILSDYAQGLHTLREIVIRCNSGQDSLLLTLVCDEPLENWVMLSSDLALAEPRLRSIWECSGPAKLGVYGEEWRLLWGERFFEDEIAGIKLLLSPATFTQVNHAQTEVLYKLIADYAALDGSQTVLDLYCGAGTISIYLADKSAQVIGVENYPPAVENAERNAFLNNAANCRFICGEVEKELPKLAEEGVKADVVILDPPRSGCDKAVIDTLLALKPEKIVYVSCDPATLARDLRLLSEGGYEVKTIQPVDMFPQTGHVECCCLLERGKGVDK